MSFRHQQTIVHYLTQLLFNVLSEVPTLPEFFALYQENLL